MAIASSSSAWYHDHGSPSSPNDRAMTAALVERALRIGLVALQDAGVTIASTWSRPSSSA
jgi:hypothetical protein